MTLKERAAMQPSQQTVAAMRLALEALESCVEKFYAMKSTGVIGALPMQAVKAAQAITALQDALAKSNMNPNCKSVQARLATSRWYVRAEQAEQIPQKERKDFIDGYDAGMADAKRMQQAEQSQLADATLEPVAWSQQRKRNLIKHWAFDCAWGDLTERQIDDLELIINAVLNAAPVRTKDPCNPLQDLTDDEILEISLANKLLLELCYGQMFEMQEVTTDLAGLTKFARAVIAADRELNK